MINYEVRTQQRVDKALQRGKLEARLEIAKNLVDSLKVEQPETCYKDIIDRATSLLKLDQKTVSKLQEIYSTNQTDLKAI